MKGKRIISLVAAAAFMVGGLSVASMAGTVSSEPVAVAQEWVKSIPSDGSASLSGVCGTTALNAYFDNSSFSMEFSFSTPASLSSGTINIQLNNGVWDNISVPETDPLGNSFTNGYLAIVKADDASYEVAKVDSTASLNTSTMVFDIDNTLVPGTKYMLVWDNGTEQFPLSEGGAISATVPGGVDSANIKVVLQDSSSNVVDTAEATLWKAEQEWAASVKQTFTPYLIDPDQSFDEFEGDTPTESEAQVTLTDNFVTTPDGFAYACKVTPADDSFVLKSSVAEPIKSSNFNKRLGVTNDNVTFTFTSVFGGIPGTGNLDLDVSGDTPISPATFTLSGQLAFNPAGIAVDNETVLNNVSVGKWVYGGKTAYIPLVSTGGGYNTWINLFSRNVPTGQDIVYRVQVMDTNGDWKLVDLGDLQMKAGNNFSISAQTIVDAAQKAGITLYKSGDVYEFPVQITVSSGDVSGYVVSRQYGDHWLRVPISNNMK